MEKKPINGDAFRELCDHVFWSNASRFENPDFRTGDVVFCKIDEIWRLFRALRRTRKRIVLVTGEGSKPVTPNLWRRKPPHVAAWFGTNMFAVHKSAHALPLGLGNAGAATTPQYTDIRDALASASSRDRLLYANFSPGTNPAVRGPLWSWANDSERSWVTKAGHGGEEGKSAYLAEISRHRFMLCPPGTGEDTHRFWEALYAGCIPVIRSSRAMHSFAGMLPVFVALDLLQLDETQLRSFSPAKAPVPDDLEALWLPFWKNRIRREKSAVLDTGHLPLPSFFTAWVREVMNIFREKIFRNPR